MEPVNLGEPINSKYDDFSFVINGNLRKGFITSDRPQGKGGDDIYSFVQETAIKSCSQIVEIDVKDAISEIGIVEAEINIFDEEGKWLNRFMTDVEGKYKIKFNKCDKNYKLEASKKNYSKDLAQIIYQPDKELQEVVMKLTKELIAVEETLPEEVVAEEVAETVNTVVEDIPEDQITIDVKNIEFLLNKYDIEIESAEELDKVVKFMKDHPTVVIEFSSHTDSRGPDDWNMELTNLRAQQVVSYLVGKGINYRRVYGKGYGESMPVNRCVNGVDCTELEHLQNRRTEFLILAK
jgi:outer membrane protein OmpA-like peptidoglycan-associated protein